MLYFDLAIYKEELLTDREKSFPKFFQNIIYNFRKITGQVLKLKINDRNLIVLSKINKRILKKVDKILKVDVTKNVCISDELKIKENFVNFLNKKNINILNGRWLFKYLATDIIDFLCVQLGIRSETQEISILTNEMNLLIYETIKKLSEKVKNINILTKNPKLFKKLEEDIYEENGMILRVTDDFKRATSKSNIILNLNFVQEYLDKVYFSRNSIIVNFEEKLKINQKSFNGRVINFYHINLPKKFLNNQERFSRFDTTILYESYIYKKTVPKNIWNEIELDKIKIDSLEGIKRNYKISKNNSISEKPKEINYIGENLTFFFIRLDKSKKKSYYIT